MALQPSRRLPCFPRVKGISSRGRRDVEEFVRARGLRSGFDTEAQLVQIVLFEFGLPADDPLAPRLRSMANMTIDELRVLAKTGQTIFIRHELVEMFIEAQLEERKRAESKPNKDSAPPGPDGAAAL